MYGVPSGASMSMSTSRASSVSTEKFGRSAYFSRSRAARKASTSTATRRPARSTSGRVSAPRPGPISTTRSSAEMLAAATIEAMAPRSTRKCCPSDFFAAGGRPNGPGWFIASRARGWVFAPAARGAPRRRWRAVGRRGGVGRAPPLRPATGNVTRGCGSSQAYPRHPDSTAYRCFLPDLTGFTGHRRVGPNSHHHTPRPEVPENQPPGGVQPRWSGLRVQGTANSPLSTASFQNTRNTGTWSRRQIGSAQPFLRRQSGLWDVDQSTGMSWSRWLYGLLVGMARTRL